METFKKELTTSSSLTSFLRVNYAGELAAVKIYQGQLRVLKESKEAPTLQRMLCQETQHYEKFNAELQKRDIPPSLLQPVWEKAAYGLGVISALLGTKAAMACTVAVEEVIEDHYAQQLDNLPPDTPSDLRDLIAECYEQEIEHKNIGTQYHPKEMKGYKSLTTAIKVGCHLAIWLSKRI